MQPILNQNLAQLKTETCSRIYMPQSRIFNQNLDQLMAKILENTRSNIAITREDVLEARKQTFTNKYQGVISMQSILNQLEKTRSKTCTIGKDQNETGKRTFPNKYKE